MSIQSVPDCIGVTHFEDWIICTPLFFFLCLPFALKWLTEIEFSFVKSALQVRLEFKEEASICSSAYKKRWFRNEFQVGSQTTRAVPFIIIPMKHGSFPIEVKAAVKDSYHSDGVRKMLLVVVRETNACSTLLLCWIILSGRQHLPDRPPYSHIW